MSGRSRNVAVAHYCEGAGHATRMLAVVEHLEAMGCEVDIAGGGPGAKFVEVNGYTEFEPRAVDFIGDFQHGSLLDVLCNSTPAFYRRVQQYRGWFADEDPVVIVTDDISAAFAAAIDSRAYVFVSHDPAGFYTSAVERAGAWVRNRLTARTAERFLLPKVWTGEPSIPGADAIPPIAPTTDAVAEDVDVVVVPSAFAEDPARIADALEAAGRRVTLVGGEGWEIQESLQPYVAGADLVVCSGYSTVMESAVAGTPCIVMPTTSEQRGVVDALADTTGFYAAESVDGVVSQLDAVEVPDPCENGAKRVAEVAMDFLTDAPGTPGSGASPA